MISPPPTEDLPIPISPPPTEDLPIPISPPPTEGLPFPISPPPGERHREGAHPSTQNLAPGTYPAANAANSNAKQNANTKTPAAPAPQTRRSPTSLLLATSTPVIPNVSERHLSFRT